MIFSKSTFSNIKLCEMMRFIPRFFAEAYRSYLWRTVVRNLSALGSYNGKSVRTGVFKTLVNTDDSIGRENVVTKLECRKYYSVKW